MSKQNQKIIGVTGYLGSGKSTVLEYFKRYGFFAIDADKVVHELYEPGKDGWRKIKDFFGEEYLYKGTGRVNRSKLRKVVFNNIAKLKILEKLIQPIVFNDIRKRIQKSKAKVAVIESTTFDKKRLGFDINYILWVETSIKTAYERCCKNRSITRKEHNNIVEYQKKPQKIDFVIRNNKNKSYLKKKVEEIIKKLI